MFSDIRNYSQLRSRLWLMVFRLLLAQPFWRLCYWATCCAEAHTATPVSVSDVHTTLTFV